ncbi:MAG TPA: hypothetical protein VIZ43_11275 [Trebonia sp.]
MVSPHEVARGTAEAALTRLVGTLAVVMPALASLQALANARDYRQPVAAVLVWLAVLVVGLWLVPRLRTGGLAPRETAAAVAIAVAAVAAIGALHRGAGDSGSVDLALVGTAWLLIVVVMSHTARISIPVALLVFAVQGAVLVDEQGLNRLSLSQLGAAGYIVATILIAFAALRPALDAHAGVATRQAYLASRAAGERSAVAAIKQERRGRLAVLEDEALPLLRAIADGTLDPAGEGVAEYCAGHAAVLRLALTEGAPGGELMARLGQVLRAPGAASRPVTVRLIGDPGTPPPAVVRAVVATVGAVLGALPPQQAVLTVLAAGDDIELYLTFDSPLRSAPDLGRLERDVPAGAGWRAALSETETGGGFLEISWRKEGAG